MAHAEVSCSKHRIEVNCPHVENGTCTECMAPQIVPYVAARATLDDLLPLLTKWAEAMRGVAADLERLATGAEKIRDFAETAAAAEWKIGPGADEP